MTSQRLALALRGREEVSDAAILGEFILWMLVGAAIPSALYLLLDGLGGVAVPEFGWPGA